MACQPPKKPISLKGSAELQAATVCLPVFNDARAKTSCALIFLCQKMGYFSPCETINKD